MNSAPNLRVKFNSGSPCILCEKCFKIIDHGPFSNVDLQSIEKTGVMGVCQDCDKELGLKFSQVMFEFWEERYRNQEKCRNT